MKLACVVQRYGPGVVGGSESHCRAIAERLAAQHDVTVLTSCATDYLSWKNEFPAGTSQLGPVRVIRFPVEQQRRRHGFTELNHVIASGRATPAEEQEWFRENGPDVPGLLDHLRTHGREYDRVLFWTYRYAPSYFGVPLVRERAILVPTAEEDPAIKLPSLREFFQLPRGYVFLTPEEADLVRERVGGTLPPSCVIGTGLEPRSPEGSRSGDTSSRSSDTSERFGDTSSRSGDTSERFGDTSERFGDTSSRSGDTSERFGDTMEREALAERPFVLYLGRVEPHKGCETLLRYFQDFAERCRSPLQLVLAGPVYMPIPSHPSIRALGFVDDRTRAALLDSALALVVPSPYESLCIALLEGWNHGLPALVNGGCRVLKGQVLRANGGLFYENATEFRLGLQELMDRPDASREMGEQGLAYVDQNYRWPIVMRTLEAFLAA